MKMSATGTTASKIRMEVAASVLSLILLFFYVYFIGGLISEVWIYYSRDGSYRFFLAVSSTVSLTDVFFIFLTVYYKFINSLNLSLLIQYNSINNSLQKIGINKSTILQQVKSFIASPPGDSHFLIAACTRTAALTLTINLI